MDDVQDEKQSESLAPPPLEQGAIRGAFLARAAHGADTSAGGGTARETGEVAIRGAFLRHLTEKRSGAVVGDEGAGPGVVRSIYAARTAVVAAVPAARPVRKAKAAPPKKKRAAAAKAKRAPAAKRASAVKRAPAAKRGPKKRAAAAGRRATARPVTGAKKKAKRRR